MEKLEARRIVAMLVAGYPNWHPTEEGLDLYERMILQMPGELVERAVMEIIKSPREFAPPIGVVLETATQIAMRDAGIDGPTREEAWAEVQHGIEYVGYYHTPTFSRDEIARAVRALDWRDICVNENIEATRAQFMRVYAALAQRAKQDALERISFGRPLIENNGTAQLAGERPTK
jgi:hypothetical protein